MTNDRRLDRRQVLGWSALGAAAAVAGATVAKSEQQSRTTPSLIKPRHLREGDTVGLVLPASMAFEASRIDLARRQLEAIGFRVRVGRHAYDKHGYFAGLDEDRAADLMAMFLDDEVAGIVCYRGGWGSPRILPHLDYEAIQEHPKVLVGFSDVTALINAIHQRTGLVTFHGPGAASNFEPFTLDSFRRAVMSAKPIGTLVNPDKSPDELVNRSYSTLTLFPGRAMGRLVGGNLCLLAAMMGTPYAVDTTDAILFLEEIGEDLYRVDRMLTQLAQSGKLAAAAGVVFGFCTDCDADGPSLSLEEILRDHLGGLGVPVLSGFAVGHIRKKHTLPLGVAAILDAEAGTLTIEEEAVV